MITACFCKLLKMAQTEYLLPAVWKVIAISLKATSVLKNAYVKLSKSLMKLALVENV